MSRFSVYAKKLNEIAQEGFSEYKQAEAAYKAAEAQAKQYPQRRGLVSADYAVKSARAQADYLEAKDNLSSAKRALAGRKSQMTALRKELLTALDDHYAANPESINSNVLEILKAGILTSKEYSRLLENARKEGNYTTMRLVGKYASEAAAAASKRSGEMSPEARELRAVAYAADQDSGNAYVQGFDYLTAVYDRAVNNPVMIDHWDSLTHEAIENF